MSAIKSRESIFKLYFRGFNNWNSYEKYLNQVENTFTSCSVSQVIKSDITPVFGTSIYQFHPCNAPNKLFKIHLGSFELCQTITSPRYYCAIIDHNFHANCLDVTTPYTKEEYIVKSMMMQHLINWMKGLLDLCLSLPPIKKDNEGLLMRKGGDIIVPVACFPSEEFCHWQGVVTFL